MRWQEQPVAATEDLGHCTSASWTVLKERGAHWTGFDWRRRSFIIGGFSARAKRVGTDMTIKILLAPFAANNPYQRRLASGLTAHGASVDTRAVDRMLPMLLSSYDVLHLHWLHPFYRGGYAITRIFRFLSFFLSLSAARSLGCTIVWTVHNIRAHDVRYPKLDALVNRMVVRLADGFIVHCGWAKEELLNTYPGIDPSAVEVVPHGNYVDCYDPPPNRQFARQALSIPVDHTVFLFLGFIRPYKGLSELITGFKKIAANHKATLIIAGEPETSELRNDFMAQVRGEKDIRSHFGYIDEKDLPKYFAAADYYVLPYRHIVTSGAAILGMSFAKALIAPRLGCMAETLDEKGAILFEPTADAALEDSLGTAATNSVDFRAMGDHNRTKVEQWNWYAIAEQTLTFINRIRAEN